MQKITFSQYVAEVLQQCTDGLIMESEMLSKIIAAGEGEFSYVAKATSLFDELGLTPPSEQQGG